MQIHGLGTDLVSVDRIQNLLDKKKKIFLDKVFTKAEQAYCLAKKDAACRLSARFAAKEAVMKALGTGWSQHVGWLDIEILKGFKGKPEVHLHNKGKKLAEQLNITTTYLSLSHTNEHAIATVLLISDA